jgi:ribonuclease PH
MQKRVTKITTDYLMYPGGSALIETGNTKVICSASVESGVPQFLKGTNKGWLTSEYSMLPGSTCPRSKREAVRGKVNGRTAEIQRLIGRCLRAVVDTSKFPGYTIQIDCDVLQADGGTRTAAITGACVALHDAFKQMLDTEVIEENPLQELVAAISVGIINGEYVLDLDYESDSRAEVDLNVVMTESGRLVEIQGTAEGKTFSRNQLDELIDLAESGIKELINCQREALEIQGVLL